MPSSEAVKDEAAKQAVILVATLVSIAAMILMQRAMSDPDFISRMKMKSASQVRAGGEKAAWLVGQAGIKTELSGVDPSTFYTAARQILTKVVHRAEKWYEGSRR